MNNAMVASNQGGKTCPDCRQSFPATNEFFHKRGGGKLNTYCKPCARSRALVHHAANRDRHLEQMAAYREEHREEMRLYFRQGRDKDKKRESDKRWRLANLQRDKDNKHRKYMENPGRRKEQLRQWALTHPEYIKERSRKRRLLRRGVPLDNEAQEYVKTIEKDPCSYCGGKHEAIDHITAVTRGGKSNWDNLTSTCTKCNQEKSNKPLLLFLANRRSG